MKKIKKEDLNQDKGTSKKGDACHPDSEFITEEWFKKEYGTIVGQPFNKESKY